MTKPLAIRAAMSAAMILSAAAAFAQAGETMTWIVDGETRKAIVYAPATPAGAKAPLVLSFHGRGDTMDEFQFTDMHTAWPQAIVAYFQGLPDGERASPGWQVQRGQNGDRDLKLVDTALADLRAKFPVDDSRIYATGFSNGGGFTYLLWEQRPEIFAAFAPVGTRARPSLKPKQPKPIVHVAGMRDMQVRFPDQLDAVEMAKRVNGVMDMESACGNGCTIFPGSAPVMLWVHPGGHVYPTQTSARIA